MMTLRCRAAACMLIAVFFWFHLAHAQALRDPTVPPAEAGLASPALDVKSGGLAASVMTIIVRDGRPYLAVGTRLYAQGEKLGQARVERITETEVWLREGGVLRKIQQFPGIQRSIVKSPTMPTPITRKTSPND